MTSHHVQITKSLVPLILLAAMALAGGCSTAAGAKTGNHNNYAAPETEHMSAGELHKDPDRVICRRYKPTESRISEKICMTARRWQQASNDTASPLERAQRTTGGTDSN